MILISRAMVAFIGLFALLGVGQHWFSLDIIAAERGMQAIGDIGRANLRADVGGLFLGIACLAVFGAARRHRGAILVAALLLGATLLGRFVSVAIDGYTGPVGRPMVIEAIVIAILLFAYRAWGKKPEGL